MSRPTGGLPAATESVREQESIPKPVTSGTSLRILVAEDNEFNAQLLEQLLGRRGHQVRVAINGREALALAGTGAFDLLLLDVHMPELDGFQVIQAIRTRERRAGGHLPVIALTARSRKEDREQCLAAGMDDFLSKPISATELWAAVDRVATIRPTVNLLDPRAVLAACGGDDAILGEFVRHSASVCQANWRRCRPPCVPGTRANFGKRPTGSTVWWVHSRLWPVVWYRNWRIARRMGTLRRPVPWSNGSKQ